MNKGVRDQYAVYEKRLFTFFCIVLLYVLAIFLISSVSVRFLSFQSFIKFILAWVVSLISPLFLKKSPLFLILLFFPISLHCSFKNAFLPLLAILWNFAFSCIYLSLSPLPFSSLLPSVIYKASSDNHFPFLYFFFCGMVLVTASCKMLWTAIHSYSGTPSTRSNPLNPFVTSTT